ncbi:MAG: cupin domain-containing protein [Anaerolineales bacterium]|nr:cupin domain-containing protein [Anaerolineales bacterium]
MEKVNLEEKFAQIDEYWSPKIVGELNRQVVKIAKIEGEFIWHKHDDEDEFFLVIEGELTIQLRERDVHLDQGEFFIVPRGVEHKPVAQTEALILLFEPEGTLNTGNIRNARTIDDVEKI